MEPSVKQAVDWIAERLREEPNASRSTLIDEACQRFGLSPLHAEFLFRQFARSTEAA